MYDIVIKGGRIVDGSGEKSFIGDIAVVKNRIVKIAGRIDEAAKKVIRSEEHTSELQSPS